jgi:hypothetical protein
MPQLDLVVWNFNLVFIFIFFFFFYFFVLNFFIIKLAKALYFRKNFLNKLLFDNLFFGHLEDFIALGVFSYKFLSIVESQVLNFANYGKVVSNYYKFAYYNVCLIFFPSFFNSAEFFEFFYVAEQLLLKSVVFFELIEREDVFFE